jgi:uncharacterized membrane protein
MTFGILLLSLVITVILARVARTIVQERKNAMAAPTKLRPIHFLSVTMAVLAGAVLIVFRPDSNSLLFLGVKALGLLAVVLLLRGMQFRQ